MTADEVVIWAGKAIAKLDQPPMALFDLVSDGPELCLKRAQADFQPRASRLSFFEEFAVRTLALNLESDEGVAGFADRVSRSCVVEDVTHPMAQLGYQIDHLLMTVVTATRPLHWRAMACRRSCRFAKTWPAHYLEAQE